MIYNLSAAERLQVLKSRATMTSVDFAEWFCRSTLMAKIKRHYIKKQGCRCCYCRRIFLSPNARMWDIEHVLCQDLYKKFVSSPENLAIACPACNLRKSNEDVLCRKWHRPPGKVPRRPDAYTIPHPHFDKYYKHIEIRDAITYFGKTPKGEELIRVCKLNRNAEKKLKVIEGMSSDQMTLDVTVLLETVRRGENVAAVGLISELHRKYVLPAALIDLAS